MTEAPDQMLQKRVELILQQLEGVNPLPPLAELEADAITRERAHKLVATATGGATTESPDSLKLALLAVGHTRS